MKKRYISLLTALMISAVVNAQFVVFDDAYPTGVAFAPFGSTTNDVSITTAQAYSGTSSIKITLAGAGNYSGGRLETPTGNNLTSYNALTFWIKASKAATFNLAGFGNSNGGNNFSASIANIALTTNWQRIIVPIPNAAKLGSERGLFQFSEGQDEGAYDVFVDDIKFENIAGIGTPTLSIPNETFQGFIGEDVSNTAAITNVVFPVNSSNVTLTIGRRYLDFVAADPNVVAVNNGGASLVPSAGGTTTVSATLNGNPVTGTITFQVYTATSGPDQPTVAASNVQSIYSDAYTAVVTPTTWSVNTARATVKDVNVFSNNLKRYFFVGATGTNYCQIQFTGTPINVSSRTHLHIDVFTNTSTVLQLKLVNANVPAQEFNYNLVTGLGGLPLQQWKSFDIPLSAFSSMGLTNVNQILLTASAGSTVYIDNIVFTSQVPLPVNILSFNAKQDASAVVLNWSTGNEVNNAGFSVERKGLNDEWKAIAFVNPATEVKAVNTYSAIDNAPINGTNLYRLKQLDKDGKFQYSNVLSVRYGKSDKVLSFYPNPVKNIMTVQLGKINSNASLRVVNMNGIVLKNVALNEGQANSTFSVNLESLPTGMYLLQLNDGQEVHTQRFIKD